MAAGGTGPRQERTREVWWRRVSRRTAIEFSRAELSTVDAEREEKEPRGRGQAGGGERDDERARPRSRSSSDRSRPTSRVVCGASQPFDTGPAAPCADSGAPPSYARWRRPTLRLAPGARTPRGGIGASFSRLAMTTRAKVWQRWSDARSVAAVLCFADDLVTSVQFDATGQYLAVGDKAGRICVFEHSPDKVVQLHGVVVSWARLMLSPRVTRATTRERASRAARSSTSTSPSFKAMSRSLTASRASKSTRRST